MQKSKSWLKSLLIVVMAIMLVFSLVACNKGGTDDKPVDESAADYFTALWNSTKPIGTTEIDNNKDISVSFGFELSVNTFDEKKDEIYQQIDLGFDVHAVIGRTEATAGNTAIKLRLYDPSDANHEEIFTLYAFANDIENLYMDFAGKNIRLPQNLESIIWNEVLGNEGDLGTGIVNALNKGIITIGEEKKSINDVINMFTSDFGSDWSLNSVIDRVLTLFNFDANKIINLLREEGLEGIIVSILGVNRLEDLLVNGKIDILRILTSDALSGLIKATRQKVGNAVVHRANLNGIVGLVAAGLGDIGEMIYPDGDPENGGDVSLIFTEKSGAIQDLTIYAQLSGLTVNLPDENGIDTRPIIPELTLKITDFGIEELAVDKSNGVSLKSGKTYSDTVAFDETLELAGTGVKILGFAKDGKDVHLNGKIIVNAKGQLDIFNTNALIADANNNIKENKTKANVTIQLVNGTAAPVTIAEISYANGKIVGKVADSFDLSILGPEYEGKKGFVYDLGDDFNVADVVQDYIKKFVNNIINRDQSGNNGNNGGNGETSAAISTVEKIKGVLDVLVSMISTKDNHLNISTSNILATIVQFKESVNPGSGTSTRPGPDKWTETNRIQAIVNSLLNPEITDADIDGCVEILKQQLEIVTGGEYDINEVLNTCKNVLFRVLYIVGPSIRFEGVETEGLKASDYAEFKKNGNEDITDGDIDLMIYINNIKAVLATQITIDGDLQDGINASVNIKIADATLSASTSFTLVENVTFTDLYEEYEKDTDKNAWAYMTSKSE